MPEVQVVFYAEQDGSAPVLDWLDGLPPKVRDKFIVRIERLADPGNELRRPEADLLRDGVYELRVGHMRVNYRLLYFFHGRAAVLSHGLKKKPKSLRLTSSGRWREREPSHRHPRSTHTRSKEVRHHD